jgi:BON domain
MDASEISVEVKNGEVTLSGVVRDRWLKHQAEQIADSVGGVREIHNQIRVQREGEQDRTATTTTGTRGKSGESSTSANQSASHTQNSR